MGERPVRRRRGGPRRRRISFLRSSRALTDDSATELRRLVNGHQVSQAIHVAATLGLADLLADGPRTSDELAETTGLDPGALYRLMRALASVGVFREEEGRRFSLAALGEPLRSDAPVSLAGWATYAGRPYYREAWSALEHSIRTGENAFNHVHGTNVWDYRAQRPEENEIFDRAMQGLTGLVDRALLDAYDFSRFGSVVDVGGGNGALIASLLEEYPGMQGVVFDQPQVVERAPAVLEAAGVAHRCTVVGGSFFEAVPDGGDAYVLKSIIHDWEDEEAVAILRVVRRRGGVALVIERELGPPNENPAAKFSDLNMLVAPGGRERTLDEYAALFAAAGFRLAGGTPTAAGMSVLEGEPV